jgi:hypothetical protein
MSKIKQPDSVKTLIANAAGQKFGDPSCRVRNPRITARESIEIADYIVALLEGEGTPPVDPSGLDGAPSKSIEDHIADYIANRPLDSGTPSIDVSAVHDAVLLVELPTGRLYAERDAMLLDQRGGYYFRHVSGMTREQLHSKSDIAAELAHRDMLLDANVARLKAVMSDRARDKGRAYSKLAALEADILDREADLIITAPDESGMDWSSNARDHYKKIGAMMKARAALARAKAGEA